jgi:hypothetical protein
VNHQQVSTFLTAGNIKFILLHAGKSEDTIKNFFHEVYEVYVKVGSKPRFASEFIRFSRLTFRACRVIDMKAFSEPVLSV